MGSETARRLLGLRQRLVRILARYQEEAIAPARAGTEVAAGAVEAPATIDTAMQGVSVVVLLGPAIPSLDLTVIDSAVHAGAGYIVKITGKASAGLADRPTARPGPDREGTDRLQDRLHAAEKQRVPGSRTPTCGPGDSADKQFRLLGRRRPHRHRRHPRRRRRRRGQGPGAQPGRPEQRGGLLVKLTQPPKGHLRPPRAGRRHSRCPDRSARQLPVHACRTSVAAIPAVDGRITDQ
jgi:hypothetical protein